MAELSKRECDIERTTMAAARALDLMAQNGVPTIARNFDIWLAYELGLFPELTRAVDILISNKRGFDQRTNDSLFSTYLGSHANGAISGEMRAVMREAQFTAALRELERMRGDLAAVEERANIDALTGLANRRALDEFLRRAQARAMESGDPLSIFMIGDQVLRLISHVLKSGVRGHDLAARYGGEELVGVLPGADLPVCTAVAERIRQTVSDRKVTRRDSGEG